MRVRTTRTGTRDRLNRVEKCLGKWKCECCFQTYFRQAGQEPAAERVVQRRVRHFYSKISVTEYVCASCRDSWKEKGEDDGA